MKERGIIFSTELIPKIMDGTKTQTRRTWGLERINEKPDNWRVGSMDIAGHIIWVASHIDRSVAPKLKCPYGQVGDRLWVKEAYTSFEEMWVEDHYEPDGTTRYKADYENPDIYKGLWNSPRFMPRWASRIDLEITDLRAERLQSITEKDAVAEGCSVNYVLDTVTSARAEFWVLWNYINAKRYTWDFNPWVWVIEFRRL